MLENAGMLSNRCVARRFRRNLLGILVVVSVIPLFTACGRRIAQERVSVHTPSVRALYPDALQTAREWKSDAYLVEASTDFGIVDAAQEFKVFFFFRSPSTNAIGLAVWYDPATDSFRDEWLSVAKEDPSRKTEIKDSDWPIDSTEALEIAQAYKGSEFLTGRSGTDLGLHLHLKKWQKDEQLLTVWFVAYYDHAASQDLRLVLDASTGSVVETNPTW